MRKHVKACEAKAERRSRVYMFSGAQDVDAGEKNSMLVVSEFVGCSPSVSGAIRVNPWVSGHTEHENTSDSLASASGSPASYVPPQN